MRNLPMAKGKAGGPSFLRPGNASRSASIRPFHSIVWLNNSLGNALAAIKPIATNSRCLSVTEHCDAGAMPAVSNILVATISSALRLASGLQTIDNPFFHRCRCLL